MKPKFKILIAREGLIVISLLLLAGISFYVESYVNGQKNAYESIAQNIELVLIKDAATTGSDSTGGYPPQIDGIFGEATTLHGFVNPCSTATGIILLFPKGIKNEIINRTLKRDFPDVVQGIGGWRIWTLPAELGKNVAAAYDKNGNRVFDSSIYKLNFSYAGIFFLFAAYPLYLLGRFIVWAIWTLKGTNYA